MTTLQPAMNPSDASPGQTGDRLPTTIYTVPRYATLHQVAMLMASRGIGDVVVVDGDKPLGILTDRDIVVRVTGAGLSARRTSAGQAMSQPLVTIKEDDELSRAVELMDQHAIRRLPIVDGAGKLVSILTMDDLVLRGLDRQFDLARIIKRQLGHAHPSPSGSSAATCAPPLGTPVPFLVPPPSHRPTTEAAFKQPVHTLSRRPIIIPFELREPTRWHRIKNWFRRYRLWLLIVILLSLLGTGAALFGGWYGRAFHDYLKVDFYEPKDSERQKYLEDVERMRNPKNQPGGKN